MELKVIQPTFPEIIEFNFEELKQEITKKASDYMNIVYSGDQIQEAKKDLANLRKFTKALSDERIKVKKECLKPYEDFEAKIKELDGIVNKAILNIDSQVKADEEKKKAEKLEQIKEFWTSTEIQLPIPLALEQIFNEKWLNASVNIKVVQAEIDARLEQIAKDLETLSNLPEFGFEAVEEYKHTFDINKAISEGKRLAEIQKRKEETIQVGKVTATVNVDDQKVPVAEFPVEVPQRMWISFKALLSTEDALALKEFFNSRNIEFEAI